MAQDKKTTKFDVQPVENEDGTLAALTIQRTERISRVSDKGALLDYGQAKDVGEALEIPASKLSDLVRELVDWPMYYATGGADDDRK